MTRRALIEEHALEALRERCAAVGERLILEVDREGEASVTIGAERFDEWAEAVAHIDALEDAARVEA